LGALAIAAVLLVWQPWSRGGGDPGGTTDTRDRQIASPAPGDTPSPDGTQTPDPTRTPAADGYLKGDVTRAGYTSEYLDISFAAPAGYRMATEAELDEMIRLAGEVVYADYDKQEIDYALANTVYEMMVTAPDSSHNVILMAEKTNMSVDGYLKATKLGLEGTNLGYYVSDEYITYIIAGETYTAMTAATPDVIQFYFARRQGERMVVFILTNNHDNSEEALLFLENFGKYTGAPATPAPATPTPATPAPANSVAGTTWSVFEDENYIEIAFSEDRFYILIYEPDDIDELAYSYIYAIEGPYTVNAGGAGGRMTGNWAVVYDYNDYDAADTGTIWEASFAVYDDLMNVTDGDGGSNVMSKSAPSGVWSFDHRTRRLYENASPPAARG
jgi:hypothetical protein